MSYSVKLHAFEGPLDLLLHLIQKNDLNLHDIPVKEITDQYMTYIHAMQILELNLASEYLVMASTLIHMKSKLLLPIEESEWEEELLIEDEEFTKEDLMDKLKEYKRYKEAAAEFKNRELARSRLFTRPMSDLTPLLEETSEEEKNAVDVNVYDMLEAFKKIHQKKKSKVKPVTRINREEVPIEKKMQEVVSFLTNAGGEIAFADLYEEDNEAELVVTFLSVLELMKADKIMCVQEKNYEDIKIKEKVGIPS
ncbi:segregation/condensation protein A [Alkalicoccus halolimnae]|uniref:Segregation and condensation protein A n=1 Tax=Alkalicoccus halolimnae TaxID=1667239 RepID=A0A5C7F3X5_9BACI|nr:segregation/condensation protein A [Alkalicoccus halolimnae]TXF83048.1 segregation/condensation protein A [Alkalicoccus halolimnae]